MPASDGSSGKADLMRCDGNFAFDFAGKMLSQAPARSFHPICAERLAAMPEKQCA
jgi:hypothetical protein